MKFERGLNPKIAMGIGSVNLATAMNNTLIKGQKDWAKFMNQFIGKKVTFSLNRHAYHTEKQINGYPNTRTITIKQWGFDHRDGAQPGLHSLYFMQEETDKSFDPLCSSSQMWFVDTSKIIYLH
jgi:hypothetical protein